MGKYSIVNAISLRSAVTTALDELDNNTNNLSNVITNFKDSGNFSNVKAVSHFNELLDKIKNFYLNGSIDTLHYKLNYLNEAVNYILHYQNIEKEINRLENYELWYQDWYDKIIIDEDGKQEKTRDFIWVQDSTVLRKISDLKLELSSCEASIDKFLLNAKKY